jgi:hypothetical protein
VGGACDLKSVKLVTRSDIVWVWCVSLLEHTGDSGDKSLPAGHFGRDGEYLAWLEADLAAASANRATRPWIIAGGHRPFAEVAGNGVQEVFAKYNVDMYFCGHTHACEIPPVAIPCAFAIP